MPLKLSKEVQRHLEDVNLETLSSKLEALGVRGVQDLALVDDADLVRWGLSTIERRRFFGHVRQVLGDSGSDVLTPPSALTVGPVPGRDKAAGARSRRPEANASVGPARLDELVGRGSAEYQVPRLAERLLASTGPIDISELALRISRTAPALAQGYAADEWPQFIEACIRTYKRLQVEDGVLQGDRAIVSICSTVLFTASEEVVADTVCWARIVTCLATPSQVSVVTALCRASREVADGPEVWSKLLSRWYPKATLLNPDWVAQTDLEKRLEEALENDYALAALTKRLDPDTPLDIGDLMRALPQQTTPKALVKFMSGHPQHFRQSPDGKKFCVSRTPDDLRSCKDWRTVNPFQMPPVPKKLVDSDESSSVRRAGGAPPAPSPYGRPKDLKVQQAQNAPAQASEVQEVKQEVCQQLDPKVAFRLYHTGLLSQRSDQSRRGKLEVWEYYTESNSKCTMAAGDLLDLAESRVRAIRSNDPAVVHELVCQTVEGMVFKVPFGFWHRRVRVLTMGLSASQLRIGREQRKRLERKLLEFMEWVKKERGFGYYQCDMCKSRWKSGFSYEEITQQCLQCGNWQRPYRIQDLESAQEREAREKGGEDVPPEGRGPLPGKPNANSRGGSVSMHMVPAVMFAPPVLEHGRDDRHGQKRAWTGTASQQQWQRPRLEGWSDTGGNAAASTPHVPRHVPPLRPSREAPPPDASAPANASASSSTETTSGARYTPGGGGFFARQGASSSSTTSAAPTPADPGHAANSDSTTTNGRYTPGGGGFFSQRGSSASTSSGAPADQRPRVDTAAVARIVQHNTERPAPAGSASASTSTASPSAGAKTASAETGSRYMPGGGGFFASQRGSTQPVAKSGQSTEETDEDGVFASARDAANSLLAELGALLEPDTPLPIGMSTPETAGPAKRGGILKHSKEAEAKAASEAQLVKTEPVSAPVSELAASLGLSVEEAKALGLLDAPEDIPAATSASSAPALPPAAARAPVAAAAQLPTSSAAAASSEALPRPATGYKPGGGGFFAQRPAGGSGSSSSSSAAPAAVDSSVTSLASSGSSASSAGGAGNREASTSAERPAGSYRPGGGGFFASRRASGTSSTDAGPALAAASGATSAAAQSGGGGSSEEPSTSANRPAATYKPGGGGFFATRRGSSSSAPAATSSDAPSPETVAQTTESSIPSSSSVAASTTEAKAAEIKTAEEKTTAEANSKQEPEKKAAEEKAAAEAAAAKVVAEAAAGKEAEKVAAEAAAKKVAEEKAAADAAAKKAAEDKAAAKAAAKKAAEEKAVAEAAAKKAAEEKAAAEAASKKAAEEKAAAEAAAKKAAEEKALAEAAEKAAKEAAPAIATPPELTSATTAAKPAESAPSTASAAPAIPADKLLALQTLGLTLDEAIKMGILPASYAAPDPAAPPATCTPAPTPAAVDTTVTSSSEATVDAASSSTSKADVDMADASEDAEERAAKRRREELAQEDIIRQDEIRRREAAAKYAAARRLAAGEEAPRAASTGSADSATAIATDSTGTSTAGSTASTVANCAPDVNMAGEQDGEAECIDYSAIAGSSDEALVEAVNAVVVFSGTSETAGRTRVIAAQASDVFFLVSDDVFWPLLRRLAAETLALEAVAGDLEAMWADAPSSSEQAVQYAETRGYCLPGGQAKAAANATWRKALLTEVATELMLVRLRSGHGYDLPALAGPAEADNSKWQERPSESLEGVASKVQGASGEDLAQKIIGDLERTASGSATGSCEAKPLLERLTTVAGSILEQKSRWAAAAESATNGPALQSKWTLLQEMSVREAAAALRNEYSVRRRILLRRLDVTVEAMRICDKMSLPTTQRKFSDALSRMWAGWRRTAAEAPPLSEWSALAAARGMLTRAMSARVSGPGARVSSSVKSVTIGSVPDRGGVPDGYLKDTGSQGANASSSTAPAPKAGQGQRPRLARTVRGGNASGAAASSTAGEVGAASSQATDSTSDRGAASVGVKPGGKKGDGKKGTLVGARSTNKELRHQHHAQLKKEREEGRSNTYYAELSQVRYGNSDE